MTRRRAARVEGGSFAQAMAHVAVRTGGATGGAYIDALAAALPEALGVISAAIVRDRLPAVPAAPHELRVRAADTTILLQNDAPIPRPRVALRVLRALAPRVAAELARAAQDEDIRRIEDRFRTLTDESGDVLMEFRNGSISYASPNLADVAGVDSADVVGRPFDGRFVHPDDVSLLLKYAGAFIGRFQETLRIRSKDGGWRYHDTRGVRYFREGKPTALLLLRDVSDRIDMETRLRESERQMRTLNEALPVGVFQTDAQGGCLYTNSRWQQIAGLTREQALGDGWAAAVHPDDREAVFAEWKQAVAENTAAVFDFRFQRPDGSVRAVHAQGIPLHDDGGRITGFVGHVEDVTEKSAAQEALRESEDLHRAVISAMADGVVVYDRAGRITTCNDAAQRILGMTDGEISGRTPGDPGWRAVHEDGTPFQEHEYPAVMTLQTRASHEGILMGLRKADGETRWISINSRPLLDQGNAGLRAVVVSFADITARRAAEEDLRLRAAQLEALNLSLEESEHALNEKSRELARALDAEREHARRDALTGALNHGATTALLEEMVGEAAPPFALVMIDVDGMKAVNDTYGHQVGDLLLRAVTEAAMADGRAILGRYGGDEFLAVLPRTTRDAAASYTRHVMQALTFAQLDDPVSGASVPVVASVGLSIYPDDATDVKSLIEIADSDMYAQKRRRKESQATSLASSRGLEDDSAARMIGELVPLLTSTAPLPEKLRLVSHRLSIGTNYDAANIDVWDMQSDELIAQNAFAKASDELIDEWTREQERQQEGPGPIRAQLAETRLPLVMDDLASDDRLSDAQHRILAAVGIRSGISVPMLWDSELVGILSVGSKRLAAFTAQDANFLMTVATQVTAIVRLSTMVEELRSVSERIGEARAETVMMLAASAEAHDRATGDHLQAVRGLAEAIAVEMGYGRADAEELGLAAALHDIGKVAVAESVLNHAGSLTGEQWAIMREHTVRGAEFLSRHTSFFVAAIVARHHHERWDGTGYPDGLRGAEIPEAAAIVTVADSFDAMTTDRPYRKARSIDEAIEEIIAGRGTQFSPRVVDALLRLHRPALAEERQAA